LKAVPKTKVSIAEGSERGKLNHGFQGKKKTQGKHRIVEEGQKNAVPGRKASLYEKTRGGLT